MASALHAHARHRWHSAFAQHSALTTFLCLSRFLTDLNVSFTTGCGTQFGMNGDSRFSIGICPWISARALRILLEIPHSHRILHRPFGICLSRFLSVRDLLGMLPAPRNSGTAKWGSAIAERILKCTFQKKMDVKKREVAKRVAKGGRHAQADVLGTAEIVGARRCAPDRSGVFRACLAGSAQGRATRRWRAASRLCWPPPRRQ